MNKRGILMQAEMVEQSRAGNKHQTRRVIQLEGFDQADIYETKEGDLVDPVGLCPYGVVGDTLYVRETHYRYGHWENNGRTKTGRPAHRFVADNDTVCYQDQPPTFRRSGMSWRRGWYKRPSLFMPRAGARLELEITGIGVQQIQSITPEDILAEGVRYPVSSRGGLVFNLTENHSPITYLPPGAFQKGVYVAGETELLKAWFASLWDKINASRGYGYGSNPWVWIIMFKVVRNANGITSRYN